MSGIRWVATATELPPTAAVDWIKRYGDETRLVKGGAYDAQAREWRDADGHPVFYLPTLWRFAAHAAQEIRN